MPYDNFASWNLKGFTKFEEDRRAGRQRAQKTFEDSGEKSENYGKPIVDPETGGINAERGMPLTEHTDKYGNTPKKF